MATPWRSATQRVLLSGTCIGETCSTQHMKSITPKFQASSICGQCTSLGLWIIRLLSWGEGSLKPHCHSADLPATEHGTGVMLAYTVLSATHVPDCCQRGYRRCTSQGKQSRRLAAKRHSLVVKCTQKQQLPQLKADRPQNWAIGGHDPAQHSLLESGELTRNRQSHTCGML